MTSKIVLIIIVSIIIFILATRTVGYMVPSTVNAVDRAVLQRMHIPMFIILFLVNSRTSPTAIMLSLVLVALLTVLIFYNPVLKKLDNEIDDLSDSFHENVTDEIKDNWNNALNKKYAYFIWSSITIITILFLSLLYFLFFYTIPIPVAGPVPYDGAPIPTIPRLVIPHSISYKIALIMASVILIGLFVFTFYVTPLADNSYKILTIGWSLIYSLALGYTLYKLIRANTPSMGMSPFTLKYIFSPAAILLSAGMFLTAFFITPISKWCTNTWENITTPIKEKSKGIYNVYPIFTYWCLVFIHGYVLYKILYNAYKTQFNIILTNMIYGGAALLLQLVNPKNIMTGQFGNATFFTALIPLFFFIISYNKPVHNDESHFRKLTMIIISLLGLSTSLLYIAITFFESTKTSLLYLTVVFYSLIYAILLLNTYRTPPNFTEVFEAIKSYSPGVNKLLVAELGFIIAFLYIRSLTQTYYIHNGELIQNRPLTLSKVSNFSFAQSFQYQYSISCWVYINSAGQSTEYIPIISYGDKPLVAYHGIQNIIRVSMKSQDKKQVLMTDIPQIPLQKWNHINLNYSNGTFDIYFNGELIKSTQIIPYNSLEQITVGHEQGIKGKISNLAIFPESISKDQVMQLYNAFKNKTPPII